MVTTVTNLSHYVSYKSQSQEKKVEGFGRNNII